MLEEIIMKKLLIGLLSLASLSAFSLDVKTSIVISSTGDVPYLYGEMSLQDSQGKSHTLRCARNDGYGNDLVFNAERGSFGVLQRNDGAIDLESKDDCMKLAKVLNEETSKGRTVTITGSNKSNLEVIVNK